MHQGNDMKGKLKLTRPAYYDVITIFKELWKLSESLN